MPIKKIDKSCTMGYIELHTKKFLDYNLQSWNSLMNHKELVNLSRAELIEIDSPKDRLTFLVGILEHANLKFLEHYEECKKPGCQVDEGHQAVQYFLTQEINRLGVMTDNDQFTPEEKSEYEEKLDLIIKGLESALKGQNELYETLKAEFDEMRNHFILGKKTWKQLALGKASEMTMSGVVGHGVALAFTEGIKHIG